MGHGHGRGMHGGEKAKDFKGSMAKLFRYMGRYKFRFILMFVFAVAGTVLIYGDQRFWERLPQSCFPGW